jgi:NAD(P)-dependent dehydrogenase (short-subunit alcohol dehydrogenase family)
MKEKIILITGATSGIGKAAALVLAAQGHHVIIHGRNAEKVQQAREELTAKTSNQKVDTLIADLSVLEEVRQMADVFKVKYNRLDVLINNAGGIMHNARELTREGHERTIALNLLSPFLLTNLLIDHLKQSKQGRIINVSSSSHRLDAKPYLDDLQLKEHYSPRLAYGNAKLFLIWVTQQLAARLQKNGESITANAVHPGAVATNFGVESNLGVLLKVFAKLARPFFRSVEQGADTLIYLATAEEVAHKSGLYYVDRKPAKVSTKYYSPEAEKLIWDYCVEVTGTDYLPPT